MLDEDDKKFVELSNNHAAAKEVSLFVYPSFLGLKMNQQKLKEKVGFRVELVILIKVLLSSIYIFNF